MAVFLVPIIPIVIGALAVTGAGIGTLESNKAKAAKLEEAKKTAAELASEAQAHLSSGALYPAFRAYRRQIDYVASHFDVAPKVKERAEQAYEELRNKALSAYRQLKAEYVKNVSAIEIDEEGDEIYQVQQAFLVKLEKLLGPGAPKLKAFEESLGVNYQIHKYGITAN
ncbi:hypothetical protein AZH11_05505 [Pseudomonas simiae]|nr:hypothetical protein AZH11_05505 [Pseudomonas simiae]